jgi:N-acetyl-beta-hexosaminidase
MNKKGISFFFILLLIIIFSLTKAEAQDVIAKNNTNERKIFKTRHSADVLKKAPVKLIPHPQKVKWEDEGILIKNIRIVSSDKLSESLNKEMVRIFTDAGIRIDADTEYYLSFSDKNEIPNEGYNMKVTKSGIEVTTSGETGKYYALQTLNQLIIQNNGNAQVQLCAIEDEPAFPIRGYMIDVGRNFQSMASLKKQLDILASYKMNVFHWHLTDRPAWRIENKKYPELTDAKNHRPTRNPGNFYTYDEIRELINYAKERKITVIPEIDMPGHSDSFIKSMGCKMESLRGMEILEDVLNEFLLKSLKNLHQ